MISGWKGFIYPSIREDLCVHCSACVCVCPVLNPEKPLKYKKCFAAQALESEVLEQSASGGVFPSIAKKILLEKGVVYGCEMSPFDCKARHIRIVSLPDISRMQGSKYVQSEMGAMFRSVITDLEEGFVVLFSGTPCQCAGLRKCVSQRLRDRLLLVEIICHGVMSPLLFEKYKEELSNKANSRIISILFRDKLSCPGRSSFVVRFENSKNDICVRSYSDPYGRLFQARLALRDCCYGCVFRNGGSGADITIGDYWGIDEFHSEFSNKGAISAVIVHSEKAQRIFDAVELARKETEFAYIAKHNPSVWRNLPKDAEKCELFARALEKTSFSKAVILVLDGPLPVRWIKKLWFKGKRFLERCVSKLA